MYHHVLEGTTLKNKCLFLQRQSKIHTSGRQKSYHSPFPLTMVVATGCKDSLFILGWQLWLKQCMVTLNTSYFLISFIVSSWVLNEFIKTNGTLHPNFLFKFWKKFQKSVTMNWARNIQQSISSVINWVEKLMMKKSSLYISYYQ